jgi:beta-cyano-L-alanine hydratase/nitrilase
MVVIRASVVQACTVNYSLEDTLLKLERFTRLAKERDGSQLAVFPEAFLGGYPKMSTFGASVGNRTDEGRSEFARYYAGAIDIPSPAISRMEAISKETNIFLVVGVIERDGGTLYCSVVYVDPEKGYVGKHRKLVPTGSERVIWGQGDGSTLPVIERAFKGKKGENDVEEGIANAKISATICWENYMPLLRSYYYSKGVNIYCAPTVDMRPTWQNTMVHIAMEGRCFVLCACPYAQEKDFPEGHANFDPNDRNPENVMIGGGSVIVSPLGKVLAGPLRDREDVLTVDLDLDDVLRGKFEMDCVGHYSRPEVFHLKTNTTAFLFGSTN